ncbi:MAG: hypothetical protein U9O87_09075, partial [Verrucomicrobiota bacterium]|nr:hypothetical protein [Verrucomicrobiota bacterium]
MMRKIKRKGIKEYPLLQKTIRFLISAIVLLAPCFFSGPQYWKWAHGGVAIITLLLLVSIYYFLRKRIDYVQNPIFYLISFFILVVTLQLLPLPQLTPKIITSHWYNLQHLGLNIAPSLSLFPQKTSRYLYILLSAFGLFFLVLNFFKTKKELIALTILITLSCFSHAIYAFVVDMGSNTSHLIHGGYANKNHFA